MKKAYCLLMLIASWFCTFAQNRLMIPDTLSGTSFDLTMHPDSISFLPGQYTQTFAFNGNHYLGPTLILRHGDHVSMAVHNQLGDTSTVHWHGLHVPAIMDGGPHTMIMPGATWNPDFTIMDKAATYWYHPHFHGKTALHVMKGAAGMIIVRDDNEAALNLPRKYGIDDFPLIIQSQQLDADNQIMFRGMVDSVLLVNGTSNPYVSMPAQVVRLRLLNASGERTFNFGFTGNKGFYVIGTDGGLLATPVAVTRVRLSPGERAEVLLDLSGMTGQTIYLMSYASELSMGVQGGPTMPMPAGSPPMNSSLNGVNFNILTINVDAATALPVIAIPASLVTLNPWAASTAATTRNINFTADSATVMDGPFYFNGNSFDMMRIDYRIPLNNTEIWSLTNQTMVAHPFHMHDVQFYVLDRDGNAPPLAERGRKDVVMVAPNETVRIIAKFEDFADTTTPYMFHCHILMHEDDGMMGQFMVVPEATSIPDIAPINNDIVVYPNPAKDLIRLTFNNNVQVASIEVYNLLGQKIGMANVKNTNNIEYSIKDLPSAYYIIKAMDKQGNIYMRQFIKAG